MTSGEHAMWDAGMAEVRRRAMPPMFDPEVSVRLVLCAARAQQALGESARRVEEALRRFSEAYRASSPSAVEELRYLTRGVTR